MSPQPGSDRPPQFSSVRQRNALPRDLPQDHFPARSNRMNQPKQIPSQNTRYQSELIRPSLIFRTRARTATTLSGKRTAQPAVFTVRSTYRLICKSWAGTSERRTLRWTIKPGRCVTGKSGVYRIPKFALSIVTQKAYTSCGWSVDRDYVFTPSRVGLQRSFARPSW